MSYFLRNFPSPFEADAFARAPDEQLLFERIRADHVQLLVQASRQRFGQTTLLEMPAENGMGGGGKEDKTAANQSAILNAKAQTSVDDESAEELASLFHSLDLAATPTPFGANALIQTVVYRLKASSPSADQSAGDDRWPEHWLLAQIDKENGSSFSGGHPFSAPFFYGAHSRISLDAKEVPTATSSGANDQQLVSLGLDCVFSVLLELNRREPELCAQSLQSLLQLLQHMAPQSLGGSRAMTARMHELLRELRREGNASVSAGANACMMSLAVASGQPEFLFATVAALLCEPKRHLPHNQADSNPLPRNVQQLAQAAQRVILGQSSQSRTSSWLPLERRAPVCEFDVIFTGSSALGHSAGLGIGDGQGRGAAAGVQGCLVSDGAFIYLLTQHGLLKMGTGLSESRAGEVLTCNELLRFSDGSALFISNESLYLRRRHSSRLWVLDTDNLREIGEIMLPSALTSQGQLFADGRQFWHAQLDDHWHLVCTPLDDSFSPQQQQSPDSANGGGGGGGDVPPRKQRAAAPPAGGPRLVETEFCAFGQLDELQQRLLQSMPARLRVMAADLQLGSAIAFVLTRCGHLFYAGPGSIAFGLDPPSSNSNSASPDPANNISWARLALPEPIVSMALEPTANTLVLRSGAGNLWLLGGPQAKSPRKSPAKSPKKQAKEAGNSSGGSGGTLRKLRVPNKRKCVSMSAVSVGGGCLAYATENGRCFLLGRHVLNSGGGCQSSTAAAGRLQLTSAASSPSRLAPQPVAGLDNIAVAQVALGKTHLVVVGKNGAVYATGLNNQNQCGRPMVEQLQLQRSTTNSGGPLAASASSSVSAHSSASFGSNSASQQQQQYQFCSPSEHLFHEDQAWLCLRCGQCSVRGSSCSGAGSAPKGSQCPCARPGPSCCLRCGLCRPCAEERAGRKETAANNGFSRQLRLAVSPKAVRMQLGSKREMLGIGHQQSTGNAPLARDELTEEERRAGTHHQQHHQQAMAAENSNRSTNSTRIFGPERVQLQQQPTIKVASVSVGNFHTVVLSADNQVYTFGANTHGQLGTGDTLAQSGAHKLSLPANVQVVQAVAGANHTVLRTLDGRLITFGAHKAGQLGRRRLAAPAESTSGGPPRQWFAEPGFVPGFGQAYGHLASWASAQGDRTLVQIQRQLLSRAELAEGRLSANGACLLLLPGQPHSQGRPPQLASTTTISRGYLLLQRVESSGQRQFRQLQWEGDVGQQLAMCSFCLDPKHADLLWAYDPRRMCIFALTSAVSKERFAATSDEPRFLQLHRQMILRSTELMVGLDEPSTTVAGGSSVSTAEASSPVRYSDCQLGLLLLSTCLSLCLAAIMGLEDGDNGVEEAIKEENEAEEQGQLWLADSAAGGCMAAGRDCRMVSRFENFGGGWGYSAHCVEAIQFKTNRDIFLCGVGLFGGRGEYTARLKLYRLLEETAGESPTVGGASAVQQCVELLAETDEVLYECGPRETAILQLERPIRVSARRWHVIWVQILGPSSDCGAGGQALVRVDGDSEEDIVEFHFRPNALSNNGTNVEVGQIPELYFLCPIPSELEEEFESQAASPRRPLALRSARGKPEATAVGDGQQSRRNLISAAALFDIQPKTVEQLLAIAGWALASALPADGQPADELLDCDCLWRQERAALIALLCLRLVRLFLFVLPLRGREADERLGPGQAVALHQLLRHILTRRAQGQDPVGDFLLAEAVSSYVACAHLFTPTPELLRVRLSEQMGQAEHNWWLLALLCSLERLGQQLLPILGLDTAEKEAEAGEKRRRRQQGRKELAEAFWRAEADGGGHQAVQHSADTIVRFLFELSFAEVAEEKEEEDEEKTDGFAMGRTRLEQSRQLNKNALLLRLNSAAIRLLSLLCQQLVHRCAPPAPASNAVSPASLPPQQSPGRFRHISALPQWEVGGGADSWDAIGLRAESGTISLRGVGIFSGTGSAAAPGKQPASLEMELLQSGAQPPAAEEDWQLLERVHAQLESFPVQSVLFTRPWPLQPGLSYTIRVRFCQMGKTAYGEGGLPTISLGNHSRLHFLPSAMSRNGTTVTRGQFPHLLFSEMDNKSRATSTDNGPCPSEEDGQQKSARLLFLQLLRLLVQRLGHRMVHRAQTGQRLFRPGEQSLCATMLGQANLLVESRPQLAFDIVTILDEAIPILGHVNSAERPLSDQTEESSEREEEEEDQLQQSSGSSSSSVEGFLLLQQRQQRPSARPKPSPAPLWAETPHPYRAGQLWLQQLSVPGAQQLSIRFDPQCRTAGPGDRLWLYAVTEAGDGDLLFPLGRFSERNWPRGSLLLPGHRLWLLFEAGQRSAETEAEACFGFRCMIEPLAKSGIVISSSSSTSASFSDDRQPNRCLERHFLWCLANACRQLLQPTKVGKEEEAKAQQARALLNRHPLLARRGIRFGDGCAVPTLGQLIQKDPDSGTGIQAERAEDRQFMEQFVSGQPAHSPAALLALALCHQPFVHLGNSQLRFLPSPEQLRAGKPVEIQFVARDRHNRDVLAAAEHLDVLVVMSSGAVAGGFQESASKSSTSAGTGHCDWAALKAEQMKCQFRPTPMGRALYQCISLLPPLAGHSLEELRFAFAYGQPSKERIRLSRAEGGTFSASWTPRRAGHFSVKCFVDGRPLATQPAPLEVHELEATSAGGGSPLRVLSTQNAAAVAERQSKVTAVDSALRRAHFPSVSQYFALRLRTHPSLTAQSMGQLERGSWLDFTEVLRNGDGVWLRLGEASRRRLLPAKEHEQQQQQQQRKEPFEAWALQFNAHLQAVYLQMSPPSNGNFIVQPSASALALEKPTTGKTTTPAAGPTIPIISILDSPKFRKRPSDSGVATIPMQMPFSPSMERQPPAIGPALLEAFRWTFCALAWHSAPGDGFSLESMMAAAAWLKDRPELVDHLWEQRSSREVPDHLAKAMENWRKMSDALWRTIRQQNGKANGKMAAEEELLLGNEATAAADEKEEEEEEADSTGLARCELCGAAWPRPIGSHMRQEHPGCGGPSLGCGYNSGGQWTTGWSGQCGEGGTGNAVWYLLCAQCRQRHLQRKAPGAEMGPTVGVHPQNSTSAERLKRNAQFLLELNRDQRWMGKQAGQAVQHQQQHHPVLAVDPYPQAGPMRSVGGEKQRTMTRGEEEEEENKRPTTTAGHAERRDEKWHSSDPGHGTLGPQPSWPLLHQLPPSAAGAQFQYSASVSANFWMPASSASTDEKPPTTAGNISSSSQDNLLAAVTNFVTGDHQLASMRALFRHSLHRAVSFGYAFRVWGWLLQMGTGLESAADIVWHLLSTLRQFAPHSPLLPHPAQLCLLAGPGAIAQMVEQFHLLLQQLANILQAGDTEAVDPRLKCLCFRAWTFQLTGHEQALLPTIRSLLSAVGNVLSASSETATGISNSAESGASQPKPQTSSSSNSGQLQLLEDLTAECQVEASSRDQLIACLLDGSCETFWESGPEDRGRERRLVLSWAGADLKLKLAALFVDNASDVGFRVNRVLAMGGPAEEAKRQLMDTQVEKDFVGWLKFPVAGQCRVEISLWGDETGCRLRQLRLFGLRRQLPSANTNAATDGETPTESAGQPGPSSSAAVAASIRPSNSQQQLFAGAQGDAFALFQSLATQVFGDEFAAGEGNGTLREQVLDLLFSRSQLQPLQSFVGAHVSHAVEREVANLGAKRKRHFSYVSALLQMLGRMCSAQPSPAFVPESPLLVLLSQLWLFAPQSVQRQALEATEKLLAQTPAEGRATLDVPKMVEHLLALVAKAISVQVKERRQRGRVTERHTLASHVPDIPPSWCADLPASVDSAQLAIRLLRQLSPQWRPRFWTEVGGHVMRLSALLRDFSNSARGSLADAIRCGQFWLALAALTVMDGPGWLEATAAYQQLKADQSRAKDPLCENHDDGRTRAQLRCQSCALSLCRDCFSVLHLSRRNQTHRARLVGSALAPLPRADFHEGCHRLRCGQQLLVLLNPKSLAGLVELGEGPGAAPALGRSPSSLPSSSSSMQSFRKSSQEIASAKMAAKPPLDNGNGEEMDECRESEEEEQMEEMAAAGDGMMHESANKCRFCGTPLKAEQLFNGVCEFEECRQKQSEACSQTLRCGHWCPGIRGEQQCPPCLHCLSGNRQDADDLCAICYSERLGESACLQLGCQHFFHAHCVRTALEKKWPGGPRISFRFMQCPLCKAQIEHPALEQMLAPLKELYADVAQKARLRLEYEGGGGGQQLASGAVGSSQQQADQSAALLELALEKYVYVQCSRCQKAYFGGDVRCQQMLEEAGLAERAFDPAELVCGSCATSQLAGAGGSGACGRHGTDFLEFKCRFCCSVAIYFCFGSTHFCAACHSDFQRLMSLPREALPKCPAAPRGQQLPASEPCPLRVAHPPAGEEFALGCGICRNLNTF